MIKEHSPCRRFTDRVRRIQVAVKAKGFRSPRFTAGVLPMTAEATSYARRISWGRQSRLSEHEAAL